MKSPKNLKSLPPGWTVARLGEICRVFAGSAAPQGKEYFDSSGPPFFRVSDLGKLGRTNKLTESQDKLSQKALERCQLVLARKGTIVFPKSGAAIATNNRALLGVDGYIVSHLMALEPTEFVISEWVYYTTCQIDMMEHSDNTGYPSLKKSMVEKIEIPLPPLPEQKRIGGILNEKMAAVEQAREAAEQQLENAKALLAAYLTESFQSEESKEWPVVLLSEVADIVSGITLGRQVKNGDVRKVPYLRVANVKDGYLDLDDVYEIEATPEEIAKLRLKKNDLLLTEGGDPDKLGRGTFWNEEIPLCIHQNHIFRVRLSDKEYDSGFVVAQLGSFYGKNYFLRHAKQTTGIATINQRVLGAFPLLSPNMATQREIAEKLDRKTNEASRLIELSEQEFLEIGLLSSALLRQAFSGER